MQTEAACMQAAAWELLIGLEVAEHEFMNGEHKQKIAAIARKSDLLIWGHFAGHCCPHFGSRPSWKFATNGIAPRVVLLRPMPSKRRRHS